MKGKPNQQLGLSRVVLAYTNSLKGLKAALKYEAAFRQECALAAILIPLALWVGHTPMKKMFLIASVFLVLIVELLNSAIEAVVDRVGYEYHELSGIAKDVASAAVFLTLLLTAFIWLFISLSHLTE